MTKITSNLQIDSARLWGTIHETAKFGGTPKGGVRRLTLGPEDKQVRDWFRKACEAAGLEVHVDALGSMFGLRKGRDMSKAPIGVGSHLDTQPTGGKFDGVLGTLAALEVVRTLNDAGIETETPICICNWTNEEGSRFAPAMMASAAYVGDFTTDDILSRKDIAGVTVGEALDEIGYRGDIPVGTQKFSGFVELHIEQGPILEAESKTIGVREAIATIAAKRKVEVAFDKVWHKPPTHFNKDFVNAVESAAESLGYSHRRITSGAGHDACNLNNIMPTAMVFIPSKDGISHNE